MGTITMKQNGFSMIELMVTVAVMSLGIVLIYQSFLMIAGVTTDVPRYTATQLFMDDAIWKVQDRLRREGYLLTGSGQSEVMLNGQAYSCRESSHMIDARACVYKTEIELLWKSNGKIKRNLRETYIRK